MLQGGKKDLQNNPKSTPNIWILLDINSSHIFVRYGDGDEFIDCKVSGGQIGKISRFGIYLSRNIRKHWDDFP